MGVCYDEWMLNNIFKQYYYYNIGECVYYNYKKVFFKQSKL